MKHTKENPVLTEAKIVEPGKALMIRQINIQSFDLRLVGTSPLIVHRFSEKSAKQIKDKQAKAQAQAKEARDPNAEYLAAFYLMPGRPPELPPSAPAGDAMARYGFPASAFKNAAVDACSFVDGITKVEARGAFHILAEEGPLVSLQYGKVGMREDTVRIGMGSLDLRYRPEFTDWSVDLKIQYDASFFSPQQIIGIFNQAGFSVGVGEWRPQRDGSNGMFQVAEK